MLADSLSFAGLSRCNAARLASTYTLHKSQEAAPPGIGGVAARLFYTANVEASLAAVRLRQSRLFLLVRSGSGGPGWTKVDQGGPKLENSIASTFTWRSRESIKLGFSPIFPPLRSPKTRPNTTPPMLTS